MEYMQGVTGIYVREETAVTLESLTVSTKATAS